METKREPGYYPVRYGHVYPTPRVGPWEIAEYNPERGYDDHTWFVIGSDSFHTEADFGVIGQRIELNPHVAENEACPLNHEVMGGVCACEDYTGGLC